jgi:hypothetical protein
VLAHGPRTAQPPIHAKCARASFHVPSTPCRSTGRLTSDHGYIADTRSAEATGILKLSLLLPTMKGRSVVRESGHIRRDLPPQVEQVWLSERHRRDAEDGRQGPVKQSRYLAENFARRALKLGIVPNGRICEYRAHRLHWLHHRRLRSEIGFLVTRALRCHILKGRVVYKLVEIDTGVRAWLLRGELTISTDGRFLRPRRTGPFGTKGELAISPYSSRYRTGVFTPGWEQWDPPLDFKYADEDDTSHVGSLPLAKMLAIFLDQYGGAFQRLTDDTEKKALLPFPWVA